MEQRVFASVLVVASMVLAGGCSLNSQGGEANPRSGPPQGKACVSVAVLSYDAMNQKITVLPPSLPAIYPRTGVQARDRGICWVLAVNGTSDSYPFKKLMILLHSAPGQGGPIFSGDPNFQGDNMAWASFVHEPNWNGGTSVTVKYDVTAELKNGTVVTIDPDLVIQK